jgi:hypothetical protein
MSFFDVDSTFSHSRSVSSRALASFTRRTSSFRLQGGGKRGCVES